MSRFTLLYGKRMENALAGGNSFKKFGAKNDNLFEMLGFVPN
jgi:hypothetical protein